MSRGRPGARRFVVVAAVVLMALSLVGFIVSMMANSFWLDHYDAYGDVPVPGEGTVRLPQGDVNISFHTRIIGNTSGSGLPIPRLSLTMVPPEGVADPPVTESFGPTTTINGDSHRRVWIAHIAVAGDYTIKTQGQVSAFISPRLAFGQKSSLGALPWVFAGVFGLGLAAVLAGRFIGRSRPAPGPPSSSRYEVTDDDVRIQQLETLASLHSSGALTDQEFQAEKRRLLGG